jgi:DNA uptake protein ComE-like DNA-binding protein
MEELPEPVRTAEVSAAPRAARATQQQPAPKAPAMARSDAETLNTATRQQLLSVYGIGPVLADRIIQNRPYAAAYDVVEKGIIPESIFVQLRKQLLDQHSP